MALKPGDGLHLADFIPWILSASATVLTGVGVWFVGLKRSDDRRTEKDDLKERNRLDTAENYYDLTQSLMAERTERERVMAQERAERAHERDLMEAKIAELRGMIEQLQELRRGDLINARTIAEQNVELQAQITKKDWRIEQLQGEIRQLKQVAQSTAIIRGDGA